VKRLMIVISEGQTEQTFVREVLKPEFSSTHEFHAILPGKQGGDIRYARVRPDILIALRQDARAFCTTMLDFYLLGTDFPGMPPPARLSAPEKAERIEKAMLEDIAAELGPSFNKSRFIPYIQMHEFEGLLFSDPAGLAQAMDRPDLREKLENIRREFGTPEDINDGKTTAPSKRILALCPNYGKVRGGSRVAKSIGFEAIRRECPHFAAWIRRIQEA